MKRFPPIRGPWLRGMRRIIAVAVLALLPGGPALSSPPADGEAAQRMAWKRMAPALETLFRSAGTVRDGKAEMAAATLVEQHALFAEEVLGRPVPRPRREITGAAILAAAARAGDPARARALRSTGRNRALLLELLGGDGDPEEAEFQFLRAQDLEAAAGEQAPAVAGADLVVASHSGAVELRAEEVRILSDAGLAGHRNGVVDAGESVTLQLPLVVSPTGSVKLARGVLRSLDPMARVEEEELPYATRDMSGKVTAGHPPGTVLRPRSGFVFTVMPSCPDGHPLSFELEFLEEGGKRTVIPFTLRAYSPGGLVLGDRTLEDGGAAGGRKNGILEPEEEAVLVASLKFEGSVAIAEAAASLQSFDERLRAGSAADPGTRTLAPGTGTVLRFPLSSPAAPAGSAGGRLRCELAIAGTIEGRSYRWTFPVVLPFGISDARWEEILQEARGNAEDGFALDQYLLLQREGLEYRLAGAGGAEARRLLAEAIAELGPDFTPGGDIGVGGGAGGIFGARRNPDRSRRIEGGEGTEEAVAAGLAWLAAHQSEDGSWDADGFGKKCEGRPCGGPGNGYYDSGLTGLAVMAFLGAGETHRTPRHGAVVRRALDHLISIQDRDGCIGSRDSNHFVYLHAAATIALCEAWGQTRSRLFRRPAEKAVAFILECRNPGSAWRYGVKPQDNDTSVTAWMMEALHAGEAAGIPMDRAAREGAMKWLGEVTEPEWGRAGYTARGNGPARPEELMDAFPADRTEALTAAGILIRILCGRDRTDGVIKKGVDLCLKCLPRWNVKEGTIDFYYWHLGSAALFQVGGTPWKTWNEAMKKALLPHQRMDRGDHRYGSWDPVDPWGGDGGRIYSTAINTLTLEVYIRYARLR